MMKRVLAILLVLAMSLSMIACAGKPAEQPVEAQKPADTETTQTPEQTEKKEDRKPITIKLGWAETAERTGHPLSEAAYTFKEYVEAESNGLITVELYPAAQLGDAKSMLQQVEQGIIQCCLSVSNSMFASSYYSDLSFLDIPYLFSSNQQAFDLLYPTTDFFKDLSGNIATATGIRPIAFVVEGARHITNKVREIRTPADLKGIKIRTMEVPAHMKMFEAMGALPTPVAWTELYTALQTGVVDGQENPILNAVYLSAWEVQKYMTLDGHIYLCGMFLMNDDYYNSLDDDLKAIIDAGGAKASEAQFKMMTESEASNLALLQEKGIVIYTPTEEELAEFKAVTREAVLPYLKTIMDHPELLDEVLALVG